MSFSGKIRPLLQWHNDNILLPVTLCFIIGTATGVYSPSLLSPGQTHFLFLLLTTAALFLYFTRKTKAVFIALPLFLLLGHVNSIHHLRDHLQPGHIAPYVQSPRQVTLLGTLATMVEHGNNRNRLDLEVHKILLHGKQHSWQPVHGRVRLSLHGKVDKLQPGTLLLIRAKVGPVTNFKTPGAFNYKGYMAAKGIFTSGWIKNRQDIVSVQAPEERRIRLRYLPERMRQQVADFIKDHLPADISGLYQALLTGSRTGIDEETLEHFKATGTMHLLAISGLHMGLLGLMIGSILNWLFRRSEWLLLHTYVPGLALMGTLPVLLGYGFVAGMNTPVLRALLMAAIVLSAILLRRQFDLLHLVAAAAMFILICNPLALFTASFQLSFAAVTTMALFLPDLSGTRLQHREVPEKKGLIKRYTSTPLLISFTATLGTLPFMLYHFNRFSLIGPIMNLLIEPLLCFWALPLGLAAIPCIFFAPDIAAKLLQFGSMGISAGQYCAATGAALPFASIWTITPDKGEMLLYGALLLLWYFKNRKPARILPTLALGSCFLIFHFTQGLFWPKKTQTSQVTFIDVGQGNSTFLHLPDGSRILIDGGGGRNSSFNAGERIIGPYLYSQRIWRLDQAVITHPHSDHFNGMDFLISHFHPKILYINGDQRSEGNYTQIIALAKKLGTQRIIPEAGQVVEEGKTFRLAFLGMNGLAVAANSPVNDNCLVLRLTHKNRAFLFPADISSKSENILIKKWPELQSDVLLAAHHGSATASSPSFIKAVTPSLIVVSAGKNGKKYYPDPLNIAAWQQERITTYITRDQGTITCLTDGEELDCTPYEQKYNPARL